MSGKMRTGLCRNFALPLSKMPKMVSADEAVSCVGSNDNVYIHSTPSTPADLVNALGLHLETASLSGVKAVHLMLGCPVPWTDPRFSSRIRSSSLFVCPQMRPMVNNGTADYVPVFLRDSVRLFEAEKISVDVALMTVSPPDEHGFCSFGTSLDCSSAAAATAKKIVAAVNPNQPSTFGERIHISHFDAICESTAPICEIPDSTPTEEEKLVAKQVAENLVDDFATLQMGIGSIPNTVLSLLKNHKDLGIHTELVSDGVLELVEEGVITNARKSLDRGKIVSAVGLGSRRFYDFVDKNGAFLFKTAGYTNDFNTIAAQSRMTAINSAIEVDLTGQVVSDSIGCRFYSGFGGQVDFIHAAAQAFDGKGKAIICLPSRTKKGQSKIVPFLKQGSGVVTSRGHVNYVVTEHGIADLFGLSVVERAKELIRIAHPEDREFLAKSAFKRFKVSI